MDFWPTERTHASAASRASLFERKYLVEDRTNLQIGREFASAEYLSHPLSKPHLFWLHSHQKR